MGAVILAPELVAEMTQDELADYEAYLRAEQEALDTAQTSDDWRESARTEQLPPDGDWWIWYLRGGRGAGKTWTGSNALAELIQTSPPGEWAVVAPTYGDARDTCIESAESGLLAALGLPRSYDGWNRSMGELRLPSGSIIYADGADDGALRIQGKNLRGAWCDEIGLWKRWKVAWDESLRFAVRKAPAKIIATGTPKRGMPAITLVRRLLADDTVAKSLLRTVDNADHLHPAALENLLRLRGTALGMQELEGAVLDEADGALWTRDEEHARTYGLGLIVHGEHPGEQWLGRRVVAVDPSDGLEDGDEYGLTAATVAGDGFLYVLANDGVRLGPEGNITATRRMYDTWSADVVVVEKNHGGAYLPQMLRDAGMPVQVVSASQGKRTRAEPVAALYSPAGRGSVAGVVHCEVFDTLEDQLTSWTGAPGEPSPDRLDSLVWALSALVDVNEDFTLYDDDLGYERVSIGPAI